MTGARTVAPGVTTRNGETFTARLSGKVDGRSTSVYLGTTHDLQLAAAMVLEARARRARDHAAVLEQEAAAKRAAVARRERKEEG